MAMVTYATSLLLGGNKGGSGDGGGGGDNDEDNNDDELNFWYDTFLLLAPLSISYVLHVIRQKSHE